MSFDPSPAASAGPTLPEMIGATGCEWAGAATAGRRIATSRRRREIRDRVKRHLARLSTPPAQEACQPNTRNMNHTLGPAGRLTLLVPDPIMSPALKAPRSAKTTAVIMTDLKPATND